MTLKAEISDSAKHKGTTRAHLDNWQMKVKIFPHFVWRDQHYSSMHCLQQFMQMWRWQA